MSGHLYLVGTPIGHLGDVTERARETLARVSHIFAEDTRHSRVLLSHLGIEGKKLLSLHAHSSSKAVRTALDILAEGNEVALVTDAGMPGVSDPGSELVQAARAEGVAISVIPGPSAVTSAVALSGLVNGPFTFLGFLPRKGRSRDDLLRLISSSTLPTVLFESPHRIGKTLSDLGAACGSERVVAICRELTKHFEETLVGPLATFAARAEDSWRGEITVVVAGHGPGSPSCEPTVDWDAELERLLAAGESVRAATELVCQEMARAGQRAQRRQVYARALELNERARKSIAQEQVTKQ